MTDKERRAAKYLPFDSLKGFNERLIQEDQKLLKIVPPVLSEDERLAMDFILFECFSRNRAVTISYYEDGNLKRYSGVIEKIDILNKQIYLMPKRRFGIDYIFKVAEKD